MSDSLPDTSTFACDLSVMGSQERERHFIVVHPLFQSVQEVRELPDGYGFHWDVANWMPAAEFISRERLCCPFFSYKLELESGNKSFWLHITGQKGVKEFIRAEFGENVFGPGRNLIKR